MLLLYTGLAIIGVVILSGGDPTRLLEIRLHRLRLLLGAVGLHLLVSRWHPTGTVARGFGFVLVLASIALVVRFVVANLSVTNMSVVLVGLVLNGLCVLVNGGMPVALPAAATEADRAPYEHSLTHHTQRGDDHLTGLGDHLRLPGPEDTPISYGDLIVAFGLVGVGLRLGHDRRGAHAAGPNAEPMIEVPEVVDLFDGSDGERAPEPVSATTADPVPETPGLPQPVTAREPEADPVPETPGLPQPVAAPQPEPVSATTADPVPETPRLPQPVAAPEPALEPEADPVPVPVRAGVGAALRPVFAGLARRHRRLPHPVRLARLGVQLWSPPVPADPGELARPAPRTRVRRTAAESVSAAPSGRPPSGRPPSGRPPSGPEA